MKPVLFVDFYKTISFGHLWHSLPEYQRREIQSLIFTNAQTDLADVWMRGRKNSEEINEYIAAKLGVDYDSLWGAFVEDAKTIGVDHEALMLISKLKITYTTVLITDNMDSFSRFTVPAYNLTEAFDQIVNSADVGMRKSDGDGAIFKLAAQDFTSSLLIDDSKDVGSVFSKLGGTFFQVENANTVTHLQSLIAAS